MWHAGIHDLENNLQGPMQCASWTDHALELATCVTLVACKGCSREVQSLPSQRQGFMSIAVPEMLGMGVDLNAFISMISRGEAYSTVNYNTANPNGTNVRQQMERVRVTDAHICTLSSNLPADKPNSTEKYQTLAVVSEVKVPGAPLMLAQGVKHKLNNFSTNAFCQHRPVVHLLRAHRGHEEGGQRHDWQHAALQPHLHPGAHGAPKQDQAVSCACML